MFTLIGFVVAAFVSTMAIYDIILNAQVALAIAAGKDMSSIPWHFQIFSALISFMAFFAFIGLFMHVQEPVIEEVKKRSKSLRRKGGT